MSEFKFEVGAEIKDFQKKMSDVENNLKGISKSAETNLGKFANTANKAGKDLSNLSQKAGVGNNALTSFSRTIQDAPFGMMGMSNNITNLTEQFGYLKNETGSTKKALLAMLSSLKGFGGVSLLISVATSAWLMFGDKLTKTKDRAKELREEQEKLSQSLTDYKNSLESVAKARLDGEQSAQKELLTLRVLSGVLNDTSESTINKKKAIQQLRDLYPSYLKNLSDEQLLNGGLKTVIDELTGSILKRAKATAAMNLITKNEEKRLVLESQLQAKLNELKNKQIETDKKLLANTKAQQTTAYGLTTNSMLIRKQGETAQKELQKQADDLQNQIKTIQRENITLEQNVDLKPIVTSVELKGGQEEVAKQINKSVTSIGLAFNNALNELPIVQPTQTILTGYYDKIKADQMVIQAELLAFNETMAGIMAQGSQNLFTNFADALGQGFINGDNMMKQLGGVLLSTMGNIMQQLGMQIVATSKAMIAIKKAFASFSFGASLVAGLGLIAIGAAFKAGAQKTMASGGSGGSNAGSASGGSNFSGGGFSGGFSQNNNVTFVLRGQDLYGAIDNYLSRNGNLGGKLSLG